MKASVFSVALSAALALSTGSAYAHPHVFVDGRVDFVFAEAGHLTGIEVTWLYDPLETLYVLSKVDIDPGRDWTLSDDERARVIAFESNWADTFDGAARLATMGTPIPLKPPTDFDARLVRNQLEVRFSRDLGTALDPVRNPVEVTFYEETYFFAFKITEEPVFLGRRPGCVATVEPFNADANTSFLQNTLALLGREETPEDQNVGRYFTDRIHLACD